ncbi:16654_t:CDS:1, partial [Gigaspora rosea]
NSCLYCSNIPCRELLVDTLYHYNCQSQQALLQAFSPYVFSRYIFLLLSFSDAFVTHHTSYSSILSSFTLHFRFDVDKNEQYGLLFDIHNINLAYNSLILLASPSRLLRYYPPYLLPFQPTTITTFHFPYCSTLLF